MSKKDFEVFKDDLLPPLTIDVTDNGVAVDLTTASSVTVTGWQGGVQKFSRAPSTVLVGQAVMNWQAGDTATIGPMKVQLVAVFAGKQLTIETENVVQVMRR